MPRTRIKPPRQRVVTTADTKRGRIISAALTIANEMQRLRESLARAIPVAAGLSVGLPDAEFHHRLRTITGKVKAFRKANKALADQLLAIDEAATS